MSAKFEKEKEATRNCINSVMPSTLAERVIKDMTDQSRGRSGYTNLRQVIFVLDFILI